MTSTTRELLKKEYDKRRLKNQYYSLRAFSRDLELSKTLVSDVINKNKQISKRSCIHIARKLDIEDYLLEKMIFENTVACPKENYRELSCEEFDKIATLLHFTILGYLKKDTQVSKEDLFKAIEKDNFEIESCISNLIELNLIEQNDCYLKRTKRPITTTSDIPSDSIKKYHDSSLDEIKRCLKEVEVELRDITSSTFLMKKENMIYLKEEIKKIKRKIEKKFENNQTEYNIYQLNI